MNYYSNTSTATMDYVTYYIYICEGSLLFTINIALVIFICSIKEFRVQKEFIIYVGVLLYDAFFGLSHVFAGSIRIQVFSTEKYIPLYTPWMCFHLPQVYLWSITTPATGIITIVSAIDRFISIMYPLTYYQLRSRYSFFMISTPLLISCVFVVIGGFQCYELRNVYNIPMTCALYNGQMPGIYFSLRFIRTIVTFVATLLYIPIVIKIYYIIGRNSKNKEFNEKQRKNIFRATVTVGLLVINEIICFVVPDVTVFIDPTSKFQYLFNLMNLNKGFISVILLLIMQKDLRKALFYKILNFCCCVKHPSLFTSNVLSSHGSFESRIPQYGLWREYFEKDKIISKFYIHSVTYFLYTQFIIHAFIPFNRFTLFWFPLQYNKIWSKQWYTVLILIIPAIILSPTLLGPCKFYYVSQDLVFPNYENPENANLSLMITISHCSISAIFGAICNFVAFVKYYYQKKNSINQNRKNEISMLYISCITLFAHFVYCLIMASRLIFIENLIIINIIDVIWLYMADVIILSGSLPLIFLSKSARKTYANTYFRFLKTKNSTKISPIKPRTLT